jgi:hypothetical protein
LISFVPGKKENVAQAGADGSIEPPVKYRME